MELPKAEAFHIVNFCAAVRTYKGFGNHMQAGSVRARTEYAPSILSS